MAAADADGSDGVSFGEFIAYYARLRALYDESDGADAVAARHAADAARRRASIEAPLLKCACGLEFLADRLAVHQRGCEACRPAKAAPAGGAAGRKSVEFADNGAALSFVPCAHCGRTFFPDRLPAHERACAAKSGAVSGIRETMTDGATLSRGAY
jgi:hypothetical protein